jgi:NifU-like protein
MIYPAEVLSRLTTISRNSKPEHVDASGTDAKLDCGCFIRIFLKLGEASVEAGSESNGCGYMVVGADLLMRHISGSALSDLHGLSDRELATVIDQAALDIPNDRHPCINACIAAVRSAFKALRAKRIEEYTGEKALICTCFGVTEEHLEELARSGAVDSVESAAAETNAGSGCGSCRMLIEEIVAAHSA